DREFMAGLIASDEIEGVDDPGMIFVFNAKLVHRSKTDTQKDEIVFVFEFAERCCGDFFAETKINSEGTDHFDFAEAVGRPQLVFGNAVGVEAAGQGLAFKNGNGEALLTELGGARKGCWPGADAGYLAAFGRSGLFGESRSVVEKSLHRVALQAANLNRLLVVAVIDAGAFTEDVDGTNAGAA